MNNTSDNLPQLSVHEIRLTWGDLDEDGSGFIFWPEKDDPSDSDQKQNFVASIFNWTKEKFQ